MSHASRLVEFESSNSDAETPPFAACLLACLLDAAASGAMLMLLHPIFHLGLHKLHARCPPPAFAPRLLWQRLSVCLCQVSHPVNMVSRLLRWAHRLEPRGSGVGCIAVFSLPPPCNAQRPVTEAALRPSGKVGCGRRFRNMPGLSLCGGRGQNSQKPCVPCHCQLCCATCRTCGCWLPRCHWCRDRL